MDPVLKRSGFKPEEVAFYYLQVPTEYKTPDDEDVTVPRVTVCLVVRDGFVAKGIAVCSRDDQCVKAKGRKIAFRRARLALDMIGENIPMGQFSNDKTGKSAGLYAKELAQKVCYAAGFPVKWRLNPMLTDYEKKLVEPLMEFQRQALELPQ